MAMSLAEEQFLFWDPQPPSRKVRPRKTRAPLGYCQILAISVSSILTSVAVSLFLAYLGYQYVLIPKIASLEEGIEKANEDLKALEKDIKA